DWASANGHVGVLQWWKDSGLDLEYTVAAINHASSRGRTEVLRHFHRRGDRWKWHIARLTWRNRPAASEHSF
ncbi:hypothetical protein DFJ73DRAFT_623482, partial [Zopfochytrium polystomum]